MQETFNKYVDVNSVAEGLAAPKSTRLTPKAFMHRITQTCTANPQHIVLPEVQIYVCVLMHRVPQKYIANSQLIVLPEVKTQLALGVAK